MPRRPLTDSELVALAALVQSEALCRHADDLNRLALGNSVGYGDMTWPAKEALDLELQRRGVL